MAPPCPLPSGCHRERGPGVQEDGIGVRAILSLRVVRWGPPVPSLLFTCPWEPSRRGLPLTRPSGQYGARGTLSGHRQAAPPQCTLTGRSVPPPLFPAGVSLLSAPALDPGAPCPSCPRHNTSLDLSARWPLSVVSLLWSRPAQGARDAAGPEWGSGLLHQGLWAPASGPEPTAATPTSGRCEGLQSQFLTYSFGSNWPWRAHANGSSFCTEEHVSHPLRLLPEIAYPPAVSATTLRRVAGPHLRLQGPSDPLPAGQSPPDPPRVSDTVTPPANRDSGESSGSQLVPILVTWALGSLPHRQHECFQAPVWVGAWGWEGQRQCTGSPQDRTTQVMATAVVGPLPLYRPRW